MIRKSGNKYKVISHTTGKVLGTYNTRAEAEAALARHRKFKYLKKRR